VLLLLLLWHVVEVSQVALLQGLLCWVWVQGLLPRWHWLTVWLLCPWMPAPPAGVHVGVAVRQGFRGRQPLLLHLLVLHLRCYLLQHLLLHLPRHLLLCWSGQALLLETKDAWHT
jgi:hypothetical protein